MSEWGFLIVGLILGWIIEWIIDMLYWRRRNLASQSAQTDCQETIAGLQASLTQQQAVNTALQEQVNLLQLKLNPAAPASGMELPPGPGTTAPVVIGGVAPVPIPVPLPGMPVPVPVPIPVPLPVPLPGVDLPDVNIHLTAPADTPNLPDKPEDKDQPEKENQPPDDLKKIKGIGPVIAGKLNDAGVQTFEELGWLSQAQLRNIVGEMIQRLANEEAILDQARQLAEEKRRRKALGEQ